MNLSKTSRVIFASASLALSIMPHALADSAPTLDDTLVAIIADTHVNGLPPERLPGKYHQADYLRKTVEDILSLRPRYAEESQVPGRIVTRVDTPHCLFLLLDTVNDDPIGFGEATRPSRIGDAQFEWLDAELKAASKPVIVCGHHGPTENNNGLAGFLLGKPSFKAYFHGNWHTWSPSYTRVPGNNPGIIPRIGFPSTGHWGDIGFALMRTFPDRAEIELRQNDLFGERGPDSAEAYRDAVVKDRAGLTVTIPFDSARPEADAVP